MGGVRWSETLSGHLSRYQRDFNQAWLEGRHKKQGASLALTLQVDDIDRFATAPRRLARIEPGSCFDFPTMEGKMDVVRGQFELLAPVDELVDELHLRMRYGVDLSDPQKRHFHLSAFKLVENDPGYDSWADTTTLFARLHQGWWTEHGLWSAGGFSADRGWEVEEQRAEPPAEPEQAELPGADEPPAERQAREQEPGELVATGILKLSPAGFARELASFSGTEGGPCAQIRDVGRYFGVFVGGLARAYGGRPVRDGRPSFPVDRPRPTWLPADPGEPQPVPGRQEEDPGRTLRHNLQRQIVPYEVEDLPFPLTLHHVWDARESLEDVQAAGRPAVLLNHGAGMRAQMYYGQPTGVTLVDHLLSNDFDVWVQNWRGSIDFPPNSYTLDVVAEQDHPQAVRKIKELTGGGPIHAFVHCMGSVSFLIAAVAGHLAPDDVSDVVSNNISLYFKVSDAAWYKQRILVPALGLLGRGGDPQWGIRAQTPSGLMLARASALTQRQCRNGACQVANFMYGNGDEVLMQHANLDDEVHAWSAREMGYTPFSLIRQVAESSRYGRIVPASRGAGARRDRPSYLASPPRTGGPGGIHFTLLAGSANRMFDHAGQKLTEEFLTQFDVPAKYIELPGYGHVDTIWGRGAVDDVYPVVVDGLRWSTSGVEPSGTELSAPQPGSCHFSPPPPPPRPRPRKV